MKKNLFLYKVYLLIKPLIVNVTCILSGNGWYNSNLRELKKQKGNDNTFEFGKPFPILMERSDEGGTMKGHYFHQDLYVARIIFEKKPIKHLDIGSRTDGFVAHVAAYRTIDVMDIRSITSKVKNVFFKQADLMKLPEDMSNSYDSISSLHAIEHFGLGRYGDSIDYFGYLKAIQNITQILQEGGTFYFSVPIGHQRIEFNAHRVFSIKYLLSIFSQNFNLQSFSYVNDAGDFFENVQLTNDAINNSFNCRYGCGIFTLIKK